MTQRRNSKALLTGSVLLTAALFAAYSAGREGPAVRPEAAPMDEIAATTTSTEGVVWDLPVTRNERVEQWIGFLKGRNADKTERWLERSGKYTPFIREELRKRNMPEDLIYLAFIESGYNPNAASNAAAVGLWQFIAETGRRYGLEVTSQVDERRDPVKATHAALDYLTELHERFGSWYLAAAAYNTGENRVARIMREETGSEKGTDADFWRIASRLPRETRDYVPLMLAAGHIGKQPGEFGFSDVEYQAPLSFATVRVPQDVPLAAVAKAVNVDEQTIEDLNPELVRDKTPPTRSWDVRIPNGAEQLFATNFPTALRTIRLAAVKEKSATKYASVSHRVKRGETLSGIAKRFGVSSSAIAKANGGLVPSHLQIGQTLRIPKASAARTVASTTKASTSSKRWYNVRRGDSLSRIANRYDTSVTKLKRLNGLRGSTLRPGQRLRVS